MQLIEALEAISAMHECAGSHGHNNALRLDWICHRAAEALAVARGDYGSAEVHKRECNNLAALMRMAPHAAGAPAVAGGGVVVPDDEGAVIENLIGRSIWYRPAANPHTSQP